MKINFQAQYNIHYLFCFYAFIFVIVGKKQGCLH